VCSNIDYLHKVYLFIRDLPHCYIGGFPLFYVAMMSNGRKFTVIFPVPRTGPSFSMSRRRVNSDC
jgi:hypothetical protein